MIIIHEINDFLQQLFPVENNNIEEIKNYIKKFYTIGSISPEVKISNDCIKITIDIDHIQAEDKKFNKLITLCESARITEAKTLAKQLISKNPSNSEFHRILGQLNFGLNLTDEAINALIDSLRWNPKNEAAMLLMGNIFAKKNNTNTALKYYKQVLELKPNDFITLNNIGANFMQINKNEEAIEYFNKAIEINNNYPNTYYALALIADKKGEIGNAFDNAILAAKNSDNSSPIFKNAIEIAIKSAKDQQNSSNAKHYLNMFIKIIADMVGKEIIMIKDNSIPTAAKIEFAENYNREVHTIKYKDTHPAIEHLIFHELMHLVLTTEARTQGNNMLFITSNEKEELFLKKHKKYVQFLTKKGYPQESINSVIKQLFNGINRQVFNTPIDLFIEDRIKKEFHEIRMTQFYSLFTLIMEGIDATTRKDIVENISAELLSISKIYNLVNALHFKELYKIDLTIKHHPSKLEMKKANEMYNEFLEYRLDKEPGEEYELVQNWGNDLGLESFFELISEKKFKESKKQYTSSERNISKEKMETFNNEHTSKDINKEVCKYMIEAISFFRDIKKEDIKKIAFEIATIGINGIDPEKNGYNIPSIKDSNFSGYKTLAYYYVSWAKAIPEMLASLGMPFEKEYEIASKIED